MYIRFTMKSAQLMRATDVHVFLPYHDGYPGDAEELKTLYFLPGYSGNAAEIAFALPIRQFATIHHLAVVIPDGENSFYTDHPERATHNGRFVAEELVAATRRLFPCLSCKREDTFIGGISMGGYGCLTLGLNWPETFSKIAMFSPAVEADRLLKGGNDVPGAVPSALYETLFGGEEGYHTLRYDPLVAIAEKLEKKEQIQPIWLCCGEEDELVGDAVRHFCGFLKENGVPFTFVGGHGGHLLDYWDAMLDPAFRYLTDADSK